MKREAPDLLRLSGFICQRECKILQPMLETETVCLKPLLESRIPLLLSVLDTHRTHRREHLETLDIFDSGVLDGLAEKQDTN